MTAIDSVDICSRRSSATAFVGQVFDSAGQVHGHQQSVLKQECERRDHSAFSHFQRIIGESVSFIGKAPFQEDKKSSRYSANTDNDVKQ